MKKKTYIVSVSDYCGDDPEMYSFKAKDLQNVINEVFGETTIEEANESNGDGMPYIMIFDIEADEKVFG